MARKTSSSGSPRSSSSRRKPVTIDLDAKPVEPKKPAQPEVEKADSAPSDSKNADVAKSNAPASAKPEAAPTKPGAGPEKQEAGSEKPKAAAREPEVKAADKPTEAKTTGGETAKPAEPGKPAGKTTSPAGSAEKTAGPSAALRKPDERAKEKTSGSSLPLVAAAIVGGAVSLAGAVGLDRLNVIHLSGAPQADAVPAEKIAELESGLASVKTSAEGLRGELETQIAALKTQAGSTEGGALDALQTRIDALQAEIANLSGTAAAPDLKPLETRLAELESLIGGGGNGREIALEALETRLTGLGEKVEAQGTAAARIAPLDERLTALEGSQDKSDAAIETKIATLESQVAEANAKAVEAAAKAEAAAPATAINDAMTTSALAARKAEQAVAIAPVLAAESLQRAVDAGQPFETALAAFASLGVEDPALAVLKPYAAGGLPTPAALRAEYAALEESFEAKPEPEAEAQSGSLDRLLKGAFSVVKVRPAKPPAGAGAAATGSRIDNALADRDLNKALSEWQSLPDDRRAASQGWADKVRAIIQAHTFADTVRTDALTRLNMAQ